MGPYSPHLFSVSVAFHFLKCYIWNTYVFLFQYHRGKKRERNKKEKITKKSINTCYSQICSYLGSEVPAGKVRTKILGCLYAFIDFLALWEFFKFYFIFISFCFILFYPRADPSPSVILLPWICSLQCIFPLSLDAMFCIQQSGVFFRQLSNAALLQLSHQFHSRFSTLDCPLLLLDQ